MLARGRRLAALLVVALCLRAARAGAAANRQEEAAPQPALNPQEPARADQRRPGAPNASPTHPSHPTLRLRDSNEFARGGALAVLPTLPDTRFPFSSPSLLAPAQIPALDAPASYTSDSGDAGVPVRKIRFGEKIRLDDLGPVVGGISVAHFQFHLPPSAPSSRLCCRRRTRVAIAESVVPPGCEALCVYPNHWFSARVVLPPLCSLPGASDRGVHAEAHKQLGGHAPARAREHHAGRRAAEQQEARGIAAAAVRRGAASPASRNVCPLRADAAVASARFAVARLEACKELEAQGRLAGVVRSEGPVRWGVVLQSHPRAADHHWVHPAGSKAVS